MICGALNRFGRAEQPCWSAPGGVTLPRCGSFQRETGRDNTHGQLVLGGTPPRLAVCPVQSENGRDNTHGLGCRSLYAPRDSNPEPADCSSQIIAPRAFLWTVFGMHSHAISTRDTSQLTCQGTLRYRGQAEGDHSGWLKPAEPISITCRDPRGSGGRI